MSCGSGPSQERADDGAGDDDDADVRDRVAEALVDRGEQVVDRHACQKTVAECGKQEGNKRVQLADRCGRDDEHDHRGE